MSYEPEGTGQETRPKVLNEDFVRDVQESGRYGAGRGGHGVSLLVKPTKTEGLLSKSWSQRIRINGRETNLGLGSHPTVTLAAALRRALANRRAMQAGRDPRIDATPTFREAAGKVLERRAEGLGPECNSPAEWEAAFRIHVDPHIGDMKIDMITPLDLIDCLDPIWFKKRATAIKLLQRIRRVMGWAIGRGYRESDPTEFVRDGLGPNPVETENRESLPPEEARDAIRVIEESGSSSAVKAAMIFLVLTAARSKEVRGARWDEIDYDKAQWNLPASRRKTGEKFSVPLSRAAMAILDEARERTGGVGLIFPSPRRLLSIGLVGFP